MTLLASRSTPAAAPAGGAGHVLAPLAVAIPAAAAAAAMYHVFVRTALGQEIDTAAMQGGDVHHPKVVEVLSRTLNGTTLAGVVLVCLAAAAIGVLRRRLDLAAGAALLVIGANASTQLLKTHLPRPDLDDFPAPNSFPSGHTAAAASVAFALLLVLPQAVRGTVALIGAGYVTVIAVATVWAEWHRPSDTIAGLLIVLTWAALAAFGIRLRRVREATAPAGRPNRAATMLLLAAGGLAGVAAAVGLAAVVLSERVTPDLVSSRFAFLTAAAAITAVVAAVFLLWLRLAATDRHAAAEPVAGSAPRKPTAKSATKPPAPPSTSTARRTATPKTAARKPAASKPAARKPAARKPEVTDDRARRREGGTR